MSGISNLPSKVSSGIQNLRTAGALPIHRNQAKPLLQDKKKRPVNDNTENIGSIQRKAISKLPIASNQNKALAKIKNTQKDSRIPLNTVVQSNPNQVFPQEKEISSPVPIISAAKVETPVNNQNKLTEKSPPSGSNDLLAQMDKIINSMKAKHKINFLETPPVADQNLVIPNELFSNEIASDLKTQISLEKEDDHENSKVIVIFEDTGVASDDVLQTQQIKGINDIQLLSSSASVSAHSSVHKIGSGSEKRGKKLKKKHLSMLRFLSSKSHHKSVLSIESSAKEEDPIVTTAFEMSSPVNVKTVANSLINIQDLKSTIQTGIQNMEENSIQAKNNFFAAINSYIQEKKQRENPKRSKASLKKIFHNRLSLKKTASKSRGGKITESAKKNLGALNSTPKNFKRLTPKSSCSPSHCDQNLQESLNKATTPQQIPTTKERIFAEEEDHISKAHIRTIAMRKFAHIEEDEMTCIQKIVNKQSCIFRAERKALVYQTCSLILKGVVIYVHSSVSYMAEQIQNLPDSLSGVCINNMMSHDKIEEALDLLRSDQIKILYITPDKLVSSQLFQALPTLEIALICFDEAHSIPELSCNYKPIFYSLYKALKSQLRFIPVLAFVAPCTYKTCKQLSELLHVPAENIVPQDLTYNGPLTITITRDEDKIKSLLNLFKTLPFKDLKHSVVYTDCARLADEVATILSENGYKIFNYHSVKTEYQKLDLINSFTKSPQGILLTTSLTGMGINRNTIKGVVYYSMPRSIEHFVQDLSCFNEKSAHHMFLHEEDYHRMRFSLISETIEEDQIASFLDRILSKISSEKEKAIKMTGMDSLLSGFVKMKESVIVEEEKEETDKLHAVKVVDLCRELELTKEFIIQIFEKIEENDRWLEYYGVTPTNYTIKFASSEALEARLLDDPLLQTIIQYCRKSENQTHKLNVLNVVNHTEYSVPELFKKLKELQLAKLLSFSSYDESFCFKVLYQPNPKILKNLISVVYEKLSKRNLFNLQKLDFMYAVSKISSYQSLEHFAKQSKLAGGGQSKNLKRLNFKQPGQSVDNSMIFSFTSNSTPSKILEFGEMEKSHQINRRKADIVAMFEKYLNFRDELDQGIEILWDGQNSYENELPLIKIQTQREKSNFTTDIQPLIAELYEEMIYLQFSSDSSQGINSIVQRLKCKIMKILQGINFEEINSQSLHEKNNENSTESKYKRFKEKYYKYSMQDLSLLVSEAVNNFIAAKEFDS